MYLLSPEAYVKVEQAYGLIKDGDTLSGLSILKGLLLRTSTEMDDHARSYAASQITLETDALISRLEANGIPLRTTFRTLGGQDGTHPAN